MVDLWQTEGPGYGRNGSQYSAMLYGSEVIRVGGDKGKGLDAVG